MRQENGRGEIPPLVRWMEGDTRGANYSRIAESSGVQVDSIKSAGRDGIGLEFFTVLWDEVARDMIKLFTQMFSDRQLSGRQKKGVNVCIPKKVRPGNPRIIDQ
jgi:hypothetical protein